MPQAVLLQSRFNGRSNWHNKLRTVVHLVNFFFDNLTFTLLGKTSFLRTSLNGETQLCNRIKFYLLLPFDMVFKHDSRPELCIFVEF